MVIGTEGEQGFPIQSQFVSRHHCAVAPSGNVGYNGPMFDVMDPAPGYKPSSNGTWIIELGNGIDKMEYYRINNGVSVPTGTWLNLGGIKMGQGHHFLVDHVNARKPDDFSAEFASMHTIWNQYQDRLQEIQQTIKKKNVLMNVLRVALTLIIMALSYWVMHVLDLDPGLSVGVMVLSGGLATTIITMIMNRDKNKELLKAANENAKAFFLCPKCGKPLNQFSINSFQCMACKAR